jgi:hypothetical protein
MEVWEVISFLVAVNAAIDQGLGQDITLEELTHQCLRHGLMEWLEERWGKKLFAFPEGYDTEDLDFIVGDTFFRLSGEFYGKESSDLRNRLGGLLSNLMTSS